MPAARWEDENRGITEGTHPLFRLLPAVLLLVTVVVALLPARLPLDRVHAMASVLSTSDIWAVGPNSLTASHWDGHHWDPVSIASAG